MFRPLFVVLFVVSLGVFAAETAKAGKKVAFLVGVNKYKKPGFRDLSYAERDVTEVSKQLKNSGFDVTLILGKDATKSKLDSTIQALVKPLSKEDLILVMLTGHGVQRTNGDAFYCPYDAIAEDDSTLFSLSKLLNTTLAQNVGKKLLLIDACRNDPDPGRGRSGGIQGKRITLPEDTAVMFSCKAGQQSFENDKIKHGVFTYCLLDGLRGSAAFQGDVNWFGLVSFVNRKMASKEVKQYIPKNRIQTPIPAGGVPYTILARVEIQSSKTIPKPKVMTTRVQPVPSGSKPALLVAPFSKNQADAKRAEWATYLKKEKTVTNQYGMKFNLIAPGEFNMGSGKSANELARIFDAKAEYFNVEFPQHKVRITKPYYLGTTEVTQKQWKSIMGTEPWKGKDFVKEGDDYPATYVNCNDIQKFLLKLNRTGSGSYRLPTEAEWEYACRAGSESMYCFGDSIETLKSYAWFRDNSWGVDEKYAHRVGLKLPNNFGLYDVHGNVWEWCSDLYDENYYKTSPLSDPQGPSSEQTFRVKRGGACFGLDWGYRSAFRSWNNPTGRNDGIGFRLSRTP